MSTAMRDDDANARREYQARVMRFAVGNLLVLFCGFVGMVPGFLWNSMFIWVTGTTVGGAVGFALSFFVDPWSTRLGYAISDWADR